MSDSGRLITGNTGRICAAPGPGLTRAVKVTAMSGTAMVLLLTILWGMTGCSKSPAPATENRDSSDVQRAVKSTPPTAENTPQVAQIQAASGVMTASRQAIQIREAKMVADTGALPQVQFSRRAELSAGDRLQRQTVNDVIATATRPVSTLAIDVDTAGYSLLRRFLQHGQRLPGGTVRVEELVNYFDYELSGRASSDGRFSLSSELAPSPYNQGKMLLKLQLAALQQKDEPLPPANLVFLVDVSGSMASADKLPLLKQSLRMLAASLRPQDRVSLVTYAGASSVLLSGEPGNSLRLDAAVAGLGAGGGTQGSAGIIDAYQLAKTHFISNGINRVILATDGDFNLGVTDHDALIALISRARQQGVFLSVLGFGQGDLNDHLLEQLADKGNGHYAYIDSFTEGRKVLGQQLTQTLAVAGKELKLQVEFNPAVVTEYRLIGYENRQLAESDFNNDRVDGGEVGVGHRVTALYELVLEGGKRLLDPGRYAPAVEINRQNRPDELALVKLRYQEVQAHTSRLLTHIVPLDSALGALSLASDDMRFAAAVAGVGQLLNDGRFIQDAGYDQMIALANSALGQDTWGYRREFVELARAAAGLDELERRELSSD
ncbi:vWA domain-containing protein [Shewanella sp. GXUN23E]|uniref:vWA domain-containing protein n=1 Tax=Shewanella sp. GXUN23E TaxID=3422498 RepID=UPI003D7C46BB